MLSPAVSEMTDRIIQRLEDVKQSASANGLPGNSDNLQCFHSRALVDDILAKAAQARHRPDQTDFCERLLDGVFGHPQRVGYG
jgi:hypothetical protein